MKRIFSVFFLLIFLFNVGGYYFAFLILRYDSDKELSYKLDQDQYTEHEIYLFKLPVQLPYGLTQNGYQRVKGEFEHNGEFYKLVKQKLENDTLYVVCIRDHQQKKLTTAFAEFAKLSNDLPASSRHDGLNLLSKLSKDFESNTILEVVMNGGWFLHTFYADNTPSLLQANKDIHTPPPRNNS